MSTGRGQFAQEDLVDPYASHADTATCRSWITRAGLIIEAEDFIARHKRPHPVLGPRPSTTRTEHKA
jgi:hypothetical protein